MVNFAVILISGFEGEACTGINGSAWISKTGETMLMNSSKAKHDQ
jgi:hypothetical protein